MSKKYYVKVDLADTIGLVAGLFSFGGLLAFLTISNPTTNFFTIVGFLSISAFGALLVCGLVAYVFGRRYVEV